MHHHGRAPKHLKAMPYLGHFGQNNWGLIAFTVILTIINGILLHRQTISH